ncbi:hypothetical protein SAMN05216388_10312 [Halorientalis persicus]|uniref:Uncharacterized protein n=1 Tax=Halorientalis persicus TaxID=1367881 RepID=A0A1H8UUW3_9EURY|nr:hypothetical protein SAMN05216388_10312 [Halorientalis persicus]
MVSWRLLQEFGDELGVPNEEMLRVNILADGGYLVQNAPPFLNFEIPDGFGSRRTWLKEYPYVFTPRPIPSVSRRGGPIGVVD